MSFSSIIFLHFPFIIQLNNNRFDIQIRQTVHFHIIFETINELSSNTHIYLVATLDFNSEPWILLDTELVYSESL